MISAKLIKDLENNGFKLDLPSYDSNEERILDILKEDKERLFLAIPLFLQYKFDHKKIINKLQSLKKINSDRLIKKFNKIIIIANRIFISEGISNGYIKDIIKKNGIKEEINETEFQYYYDSFKDSIQDTEKDKEKFLKKQIDLRGRLNTNKALSDIYSPGKLRIMNKIFSHDPLSNTELKYYYRAIRPLILSILNEHLRKYISIIESTKKYSLKT